MDPYDYTTSAPLEEPLQCGSCGKQVSELFTPYWDSAIQVGPCCAWHSDEFPDEPLCSEVLEICRAAKSVGELTWRVKVHVMNCKTCQPLNRQSKPTISQGSAQKTEEAA